MIAHATPICLCPSCGKTLDRASAGDGAPEPEPGDLSVCLGCGTALVFDDTRRLRAMTKTELDALPFSALRALAAAMLAVHRRLSPDRGTGGNA